MFLNLEFQIYKIIKYNSSNLTRKKSKEIITKTHAWNEQEVLSTSWGLSLALSI